MIASYDNKPSVLEAVGNGSYLYRWDIEEVVPEQTEQPEEQAAGTDENAEAVQKSSWKCNEVTVWPPITPNRITEAAITEQWDRNYEQKLVNEYNAAQLGLYGEVTGDEAKARIKAYTDYLTARTALKAQVDADCEELGIKD